MASAAAHGCTCTASQTIQQQGAERELRTAEPHNGEEKGVAWRELREKGDRTVPETGREESTRAHQDQQEGTDPMASPTGGVGSCSWAVGVSHKAPVVLSWACHLRVTDVGHLGAGAGWDWVDPPPPFPEGSLTMCCLAFVLKAFNSVGHVLFKPAGKS